MGNNQSKAPDKATLEKLRMMIEPDYGLLDELFSLKALSREQYNLIRSITAGVYQRNDKLLEVCQYVSKSNAGVLIEALQKTEQQHVVNYMQGVDDEFDDCPLEEKHLEKLNANCRQLVVRMDLGDGLLDDMLCCGCITWEQRDTIKELNASTAEKKRKMIDILTRRSVAHYKTFLACLCRDGQTDLADILAVDEGVQSAAEVADDQLKTELGLSEVNDMKAAGGEEERRRVVEKMCNEWKNTPVKVAVIGNSGAGKSSFINTIRGLSAQDEGAAVVGVTQTTTEPRSYPHPNNPLLEIWDLPGVGTKKFPKATYLSDIEVDRFDFFLLMTATRFTENDIWLVNEFRSRGKKCFFVRTKIGIDISNNAESYPESHNEEAVQKTIREDTAEQLKENGCGDIPIFLIDSLQPQKFEFEKLKIRLIHDLQDLKKKKVLILTFHSWSEEMIQLKVAELRRRVWKMSLLSSAAAAVPIPGLSLVVDMAVVKNEADFYLKRLNLDDESLKHYAVLCSVDYNKIKSIVNQEMIALEGIKEGIRTAAVPAIVVGCLHLAMHTAAKILLPMAVISGLIGVPLSFRGTYSSLKLVLDKYEKVAMEVAKQVNALAVEMKGVEATSNEKKQSAGADETSMKFGVQSTDQSMSDTDVDGNQKTES